MIITLIKQIPSLLSRVLEAMPLGVFLFYLETMDGKEASDWLEVYTYSCFAILLSVLIIRRLSIKLNPIFIAIYLYLISGMIGLATNMSWLNNLYGELQATGMLIWIGLVGVYCLGANSLSFLGPNVKNSSIMRKYSIILLGVVIVSCVTSYQFQDYKILSQYGPFVILFSLQTIFQNKVKLNLT